MVRTAVLAVAVTLILPACSSPRDADASDTTEIATRVAVDTANQGGVTATTTKTAADTGMVAMTAFGKMVTQMMDATEAQMRVLDTASAATMQARMPRYGRMADSLISRMSEEVQRMNVATDAIWPATVDSARQDLIRIRALNGSDMKATMPDHLKRMRWLIGMQRTMTGKTPP